MQRLPLHMRVEHGLRRMIGLAEYQNGKLLPDEQTLANRFGVHRGTVRTAMMCLVQQGLLQRRTGVGTWVRQASPAESGIETWRSFSREMAGRGIVVENFRREFVLQEADLARHAA